MRPIERFEHIFFKRVGGCAAFCGAAIMRLDWRPTWLVCFWVTLNVSFVLFSVYTLIAYDSDTFWKMLTIIGVGGQGFVKFMVVITYARRISSMVEFLRCVHVGNGRTRNATNYRILERWSRLFWTVSGAGVVLLQATCMALLPLTMLNNWRTGAAELPLPVYLPGIDAGTTAGWWITLAYTVAMLILGAFGLCATDLLLLMLILYVWPLADIFVDQVGQLNRAVAAAPAQRSRRQRRLWWFYRNLLQQHKALCSYVATIADVYFYVIFTEIYTNALSLCALIFVYLTVDWANLYFVCVLTFSKLLVFCVLGTMVEMTVRKSHAMLGRKEDGDCLIRIFPYRPIAF